MTIERSPVTSNYVNATAIWHLQEAAVLEDLETSAIAGLSTAAVSQNRVKYGENVFRETKPRSGLIVFLGYFWSIPVALLTLAAILSIATGSRVDAMQARQHDCFYEFGYGAVASYL